MKFLQWVSTILGIPAAILTIAGFLAAGISWFSPKIAIDPGLFQICSLALAISGTVVLVWVWNTKRIAANRRAIEAEAEGKRRAIVAEIEAFRDLAAELKLGRAQMRNWWRQNPDLFSSTLISMLVKLEAMRIDCPPVPLSDGPEKAADEALAMWLHFLDILVPLAEIGNLNEARMTLFRFETA